MRNFYVILVILIASSFNCFSQEKANPLRTSTEAQVKIVRFYPNPATSQINFDFESDKGYNNTHSFHIYNFLGKKVFEISNVSRRNVVNLSNFFRGIYIFQLKDKDGRILESGKFQVIR